MNTCINVNEGYESEQALINKAIDAIVAKKRLIEAPYRIVTRIKGDTFKFKFVCNTSLTTHRTIIESQVDLKATEALYRLSVIGELLDLEIQDARAAA